MEVLRPTVGLPQPYYSHGLRKKFIIDGLNKPTHITPPKESADIGYEVDEEKYLARVQRRLNIPGKEKEVPFEWPQSLKGPLVWEPSNITEDDFVYYLTAQDKTEIQRALEHFKGSITCHGLISDYSADRVPYRPGA